MSKTNDDTLSYGTFGDADTPKETVSFGDAETPKETPRVNAVLIDEGRVSGEPLLYQSLEMDFTPGPLDTIEVAERCIQFFDTLQTCPELEKYRVLAKPDVSSKSNGKAKHQTCSKKNCELQPYSALRTFKTLETRGVLRAALETDQAKYKKHCDCP